MGFELGVLSDSILREMRSCFTKIADENKLFVSCFLRDRFSYSWYHGDMSMFLFLYYIRLRMQDYISCLQLWQPFITRRVDEERHFVNLSWRSTSQAANHAPCFIESWDVVFRNRLHWNFNSESEQMMSNDYMTSSMTYKYPYLLCSRLFLSSLSVTHINCQIERFKIGVNHTWITLCIYFGTSSIDIICIVCE